MEMSIFRDAIECLGFSRQGTIAEARNIPDERWDYRPHPATRSVTELVKHMIETTQMLVGEAADAQGDFQRRSPAEHVRAHNQGLPDKMSPAELRDALARTHELQVSTIHSASEEFMKTAIRRFDGGLWTRITYVFYAASHEDYHRGQLATYARSMGLVPALTQRIHGADAT